MRTRNTDKEQLVKDQAIRMIVKDGLEGFSMNRLAKACKISVATLYIYYKDRDDLILRIAMEEGKKMGDAMVGALDPDASFERGLRAQWESRSSFLMENPLLMSFFEQLQTSTYHVKFMGSFAKSRAVIGKFMENVIRRGELEAMPFEVYWSVAFSPLMSLIRFHHQGKSIGGKPFKMTDQVLWKTFDLVLQSLKK